MIIVYFSGTGNSKYLAEQFAKRMNINAYSIEQNLDFETIFSHEDTIAFCYSIYGSCVPRIMREFVSKYKFYLNEKKLDRICLDIQHGKVKKRGWNIYSTLLGKTQNIAYMKMEKQGLSSFRTDESCIGCGLCAKRCPTHNLEMQNGKVVQKGNCTLCYRCVNLCPKQSCAVYFHKKQKTIQRIRR